MDRRIVLGLKGAMECSMQGYRLYRLGVVLSALLHSVVLTQSATLLEPILWQQLQSPNATISLLGSAWRWPVDKSVVLETALTIAGPGSLVLDTVNTFITGYGSLAALTLCDVTLFYRSSALNSSESITYPISFGPFPAFNGSNLNLTFINVTILAPFRSLARISSFWNSADVLAALQPQLPDGLGSGKQVLVTYSQDGNGTSGCYTRIQNMVVLPTDSQPAAADCFAGGLPVGDSNSLRLAMDQPSVTTVFLYQSFVLMPADFNYSNSVVLSGGRSLELYGCSAGRPTINTNYNYTRFGVRVANGSALTLSGLIFTESPLLNQLFWPRYFAPLLGWVYVDVGGGCSLIDAAVHSPDGSDLRAYLATYSDVGGSNNSSTYTGMRPIYTATNSSFAVITTWNITGLNLWPVSPGVSATAAARSFWHLRNVTVATQQAGYCLSSMGTAGVSVDTGSGFRDLIRDDLITAIRVVGDIRLLVEEWPPEASGPADGKIFVNRTKDVFACHPTSGHRYTLDFGNLGQVVFVYGNLTFRGSLLLTHPRPSPRRAWLYLLIGALSVETNGIIQFNGVEIHGNTSSPFTNAADPFWNYLGNCGIYCAGVIPPPGSYLNISYYDAFIFEYRFNKTEWVAVSQSRTINGTGYWGYTDVALTWRPVSSISGADGKSTPVVAIAVSVAVGGAGVLAGVAILVIWIRRRRITQAEAAKAAKAATAAIARAVSGNSNSKVSCSDCKNPLDDAEGDPARKCSGNGGWGSSPPPGSSSVNQQHATNTAAMCSQTATTSMMTASVPTEARIEDLKRVITSQSVMASTHRNEQISLLELLGEGTFGKVYRGTWRGTTVAVKSMVLPTNMSGKEKREKMAVMETAISSSLSHPNIVQTYTYTVLPVKGDGNQVEGMQGAGLSPTADRSTTLVAMTSADTSNVHSWEVRLVLEFCDRGSLRDVLNASLIVALKARDAAATPYPGDGAHGDADPPPAAESSRPPSRPTAETQPQVESQPQLVEAGVRSGEGCRAPGGNREDCPLGYLDVLDTCSDVARAMLHMHSENIVHGDLKARNILLKSGGVGDGRAYVAKVADFGLSLRIDPQETHISNVYQGTITHMAPEVLLHGKISKMSDVYAFGILMWETYTARQAFKGTPRALLGHEITKMNRRPHFPLNTAFKFQLLACRCWESDPTIRPTFDNILGELSRMRGQLVAEQALCQQQSGEVQPLSACSMGTSEVGMAPATAAAAVAGSLPSQPQAGASLTLTTMKSTLSFMPSSHAYGGGQKLMGFDDGGGGGGGAGYGVFQSFTLNSEMGRAGNMSMPADDLTGQDAGLDAAPGALTIGTKPPFVLATSATAVPARITLGRPPPPMPPN